jgi:hypothetical protein
MIRDIVSSCILSVDRITPLVPYGKARMAGDLGDHERGSVRSAHGAR